MKVFTYSLLNNFNNSLLLSSELLSFNIHYQNWYHGLPAAVLKGTPNDKSFEKACAKSLKNKSSSLAYISTYLRNEGSIISAISLGNIMSLPVASSNWSGPVQGFPLCIVFGLQRSSSNNRKYSLDMVFSAKVHGPQYPLQITHSNQRTKHE